MAWTKNLALVKNARKDAVPVATMSMNATSAREVMVILAEESAKCVPRMHTPAPRTNFSVKQVTIQIIRRTSVSDAKTSSAKAAQAVHPNAWYVEKRGQATNR
eukprot:jgi/Picsp_1/4772/NSC_02140-R1_---NA---